MPDGQIGSNEIRITTRSEGQRVIIEVRDTGVGIPPEIIGRIFDAFYTTKPVGVGTGLGLAISHRIVTGLGGELTVQSEVGKGTTFKVSLPISPVVQIAQGSGIAPERMPVPVVLKGRLLVVDDEEMILRSVTRILSEHEIVTAGTGAQALALLRAGEKFDIILCDLMMPMMTGMDLHRELMLEAPGQAERMIFLTGGAFTSKAQEFLMETHREYIDKPFDPVNLHAIVQRRLH